MSEPPEEWRDVLGWEGLYQVSNRGRVRSLDRIVEMRNGVCRSKKGLVLTPAVDEWGRHRVNLHYLGHGAMKLVHRLVAEAFLGPRPDGMEICHNDGDASNNCVSNLRWDTHPANESDKRRHGTNDRLNRVYCPRQHELADWNCTKEAKRRGRRGCLACNRASAYFCVNDPRFNTEADRQYDRILRERCAVRSA